jgi:hypothetical protein
VFDCSITVVAVQLTIYDLLSIYVNITVCAHSLQQALQFAVWHFIELHKYDLQWKISQFVILPEPISPPESEWDKTTTTTPERSQSLFDQSESCPPICPYDLLRFLDKEKIFSGKNNFRGQSLHWATCPGLCRSYSSPHAFVCTYRFRTHLFYRYRPDRSWPSNMDYLKVECLFTSPPESYFLGSGHQWGMILPLIYDLHYSDLQVFTAPVQML